jgi:hypothetical protein
MKAVKYEIEIRVYSFEKLVALKRAVCLYFVMSFTYARSPRIRRAS